MLNHDLIPAEVFQTQKGTCKHSFVQLFHLYQ